MKALLALLIPGAFALLTHACAGSLTGVQHWQNALKPKGPAAPAITIALQGNPNYVIIVPAQATSQETKAAEELAHWLQEMTGAQFPILTDAAATGATEFCIGNTNRLASATPPIPAQDLGDEGYTIAVRGGRVFLLGGHKRGPINAVLALLEEDLGCRWYTRTEYRIPKRPTVNLNIVPRSFVPPLQIRDPFYSDAFHGEWSLRNRTNAPSATIPDEWGGNMSYALFVHTYNTLVPPDQYFDKHPEMFMQNANGTRTARQLCHTNAETLRVATESCLRFLRENPSQEIISVSKNDGGGSCVCDGCRAIDEAEGSDCGSLLHFVNAVAENVEKEFPHVLVSTLAYLETTQPPKTIRPRHNVAIQLCTDRAMWAYPFTPARQTEEFSKAMERWGKIHNQIHIWDYTVNFSHYVAPMPNIEAITDNIRYFIENNSTGVMLQGAYQGPGAENGLLRCWVWGKQLWDPARDTKALMHDFIWGYYGKAALPIAQYNELLMAQGEAFKESLAKPEGGIRYPMDSPFLTREFLDQADALFDRAETLAESEDILHRVELARLPILYVRLMRGPQFVGAGYDDLVNRFETIARREGITHLREGGPDLDEKLNAWRAEVGIQQAVEQAQAGTVKTWPLGNEWRFAPDKQDVGTGENWFAADADDSAWAKVRSDTGTGWESQGFTDYTGYGWYRQSFTPPADLKAANLSLYFGAVDEDAQVWINGELAFEHTCQTTGLSPDQIWITPFAVNVADRLRMGEPNVIAVRILNRLGMGGVWKPVHLVASEGPVDARVVERLVAGGE